MPRINNILAFSAFILMAVTVWLVYQLKIQLSDQSTVLMSVFLLVLCLLALVSLIGFWLFQTAKEQWIGMLKGVNRDPLTGLPNQQKLLRDLQRSQNTNLAFMKITNYNNILNSYGPAVTDDVMKQFAAVLVHFEHELSQKMEHYYIQPGLFATLEDQIISYEHIALMTKALVKKLMSTKYQVGNDESIAINVTVGAVRQNDDAYILANMALQEAETKKMQFYLIDKGESQLPNTYKKELSLTQSLLQGIHERRIVAYFQPIFSAKSMGVTKYECLSRLIDDKGDVMLMPNEFMPLAHRANVYYLISQIMIKQAIEFAQMHQVVVTLNFSVTDINNKRTCEYLFYKIKQSGIGHLLHFELLENEVIVDSEQIASFINQLHELGCQVGMDDLGKGYSNIERLFSLPIDFVKIDRTIMENVSQNKEMRKLVKNVVRLAQTRKLEVIAEYCSNREITELAIKLGVDYLQGFHLGMPQPDLFEQKSMLQAQQN